MYELFCSTFAARARIFTHDARAPPPTLRKLCGERYSYSLPDFFSGLSSRRAAHGMHAFARARFAATLRSTLIYRQCVSFFFPYADSGVVPNI